jgi:glyoxylase-like metal-dependent hydrolase (beta-lactamase superfamily II)
MFVFADENLALVGDAIFAGSIGRTDLPGGSFEELAQSIRSQIYTLPEETKLYPGHGPVTTVGIEKQSNPHVPA